MGRPSSTFNRDLDSTLRRAVADSARADEVANEIRQLWEDSSTPDLPTALESNPEILANRSVFLDLAQLELQQRLPEWNAMSATQFCDRFAELPSDLLVSMHRLFEVERYLAENPEALPHEVQTQWPIGGDLFCGFELEEELGRGSMSRVFRAAYPKLGRQAVVLKVTMHAQDEASTLGRLSHTNVVPIHDTGRDDTTGLAWISMPFLGRHTLQDALDPLAGSSSGDKEGTHVLPRLDGSRRSFHEALLLTRGVARGLAYTHGKGVVHGDLKPSNVLLASSDQAYCSKLIDFNLSRDLTQAAGALGGTLPYMAPEQLHALAAGERESIAPDVASEVFSFGVLACQLMSGSLPFTTACETRRIADTAEALLEQRRNKEASVAKQLKPYGRRLQQLVMKCLAENPADRPARMQEVAEELDAMLGPLPSLLRAIHWRPVRSAAMIATLLIVALATYSFSLGGGLPPAAVAARIAALEQAGQIDEARQLLKTWTHDRLDDHESRRSLGAKLIDSGQIALAFEAFRTLAAKSNTPLDAAATGYCLNLMGKPLEAIAFHEEALAGGLKSPQLDNNLASSLLHRLAAHFDQELSLRIERFFERAYAKDSKEETIRLGMMRHASLVASKGDKTQPAYPIEIAAIKNSQPSKSFCRNAAVFLIHQGASEQDLRRLGRPILNALASYVGRDHLRRDLPGEAAMAYSELLEEVEADLSLIKRSPIDQSSQDSMLLEYLNPLQ